MGFKSECSMGREHFDGMLTMIGSLLPDGHILPKSMQSHRNSFVHLRYRMIIHVCSKGCVLFRKEHKDANNCPKCKSSRYLEVDSGDGQKLQLTIPVKILRHPVRTKDLTAIHDRGIRKTYDMRQKGETMQY
jgi:hypothetical protein